MKRNIIFGFVLVSLIGCATSQPYPTFDAGAPDLEAGSLVFTGIDGNLYVATPAQPDLIRLTRNATPPGTDPESSPTLRYTGYAWVGDRVVYSTQEYSESTGISSTMYVVRPGGRARRVFSQAGLAPFFLYPNPGGSRVGYLGSEAGAPGLVMGSVDLETGVRIVHGRGQPYYSAWSPDGTSLVTHIGVPGSGPGSQLALQRLDGSADDLRPGYLSELAPGMFQTPAYSPDGSAIAVILRVGESSGIHLLGTDGGDLGRLVRLRGQAASLAWAPHGNRLAYIDGNYSRLGALIGQLSIVRPESRSPRIVSEAAVAHFWSPDGTKLLYFEPFAVAGGGEIGYRVGVYSLFDDRARTVATMRPATEFARQIIPFVDQYEHAYTLWSPDSRLVTLNTLAVNGQPVVHLLDTETLEAGDSFRISYWRTQAQPDASALGLLVAEGVRSRAITVGSLPFFSGR